jgi:hypothetical protein
LRGLRTSSSRTRARPQGTIDAINAAPSDSRIG